MPPLPKRPLRLAVFAPLPPQASGIADYMRDLLPHLAGICDDVTLIRSMHSGVNNHGQALYALNNAGKLDDATVVAALKDKDAAVRKEAAKSFGKVQGDNIAVFSLVTNTLAKDKEIEDRWRKYARPQSSMNLANVVEDEVVDALSSAVKAAYPRLAHRYYKLKAKWFGVDKMPYWDRNAPLPESDDRVIPWGEAEKIVLDAYTAFSPELAAVGARFFGTDTTDR